MQSFCKENKQEVCCSPSQVKPSGLHEVPWQEYNVSSCNAGKVAMGETTDQILWISKNHAPCFFGGNQEMFPVESPI